MFSAIRLRTPRSGHALVLGAVGPDGAGPARARRRRGRAEPGGEIGGGRCRSSARPCPFVPLRNAARSSFVTARRLRSPPTALMSTSSSRASARTAGRRERLLAGGRGAPRFRPSPRFGRLGAGRRRGDLGRIRGARRAASARRATAPPPLPWCPGPGTPRLELELELDERRVHLREVAHVPEELHDPPALGATGSSPSPCRSSPRRAAGPRRPRRRLHEPLLHLGLDDALADVGQLELVA